MGLLSRIFGRERPAQTQQQTLVSGDIEYKVYVYDPQPLMQLQPGSEFVAGIPAGRVRLRSTAGGTWDSNQGDGIAFSFNGVPFGVSFNEDLAKLIRSNGFNSIMMRHLGWYDRTHQEIRALAPSTRVREVQKIAGELLQQDPSKMVDGESFVTLSNTRIQDPADAYLGRANKATFTARLDLVPTPQGSSAKPHVRVVDAATNAVMFETNARMTAHSWLLAHAGMNVRVLLRREELLGDSGEPYYLINAIVASNTSGSDTTDNGA